MTNPFNQPDFKITDDYLRRSIEAAAVPHTAYTAFTGTELPGELYLLVVEKNKFSDDEQALISFMQRMLVLLLSEEDNLSSYDEEAITNLTNNMCLNGWYNELEYEEIPVNYFKEESDFLFGVFTEYFNGRGKKLTGEPTNGPHGFFKNHHPVHGFKNINPLCDEIILKLYSLVNYHDGKYFFAISEKNYILLNWQSGGPLHLLVKPSRRNPESLILSKDAVYEALGNKKDSE